MWFELILGVIAVLLLVNHYWTRQLVKYKCLADIPGPVPLPIIGNYLLVSNLTEPIGKMMEFLYTYGPVVRLWTGCTPVLIVSDPEMAELILRSPTYSSKGDLYRYIKPWMANSILTSTGKYLEYVLILIYNTYMVPGDTWQRQKKTISHCMNIKFLEKYLSIFNSTCDIFVEILSAKADGNTCNIAPLISSYTLDNIVECTMGAKLNCQRQPNNEYAKAVHIMGHILVDRILSVWKHNDFLFTFSKAYKDQKEACHILNDFAARIIEERRMQLLVRKEDDADMDDNEKQMTQPLDCLLNTTVNNKPLSEEQIRDDLSMFIFAGHDTAATTLQFLFYQLSNNQEIQNKIVDELKEIYGNDKNRPTTMADLNEMKYMERVIKESMRYHAPVPFMARQLDEDVPYKNTVLPKGLNMLFSMYGLHRNPDIYVNPDVFDPDRFISEDSIQPYSYLPFSSGSRNCKGQKFALMQIKVTVAILLRNFEFLPAGPGSEIKFSPSIVLQSSNGINVRIKHRDF